MEKKEEKLGHRHIFKKDVLKGKTIALGVSGGIACYKAVDLAGRLIRAGAKVKTVMTESATRFIAPLTFQTITGQKVLTDLFKDNENKDIQHILISEEADVIVVAPATANIMAKAAHGIADDALSTTILAARSSVIMAPAMNNHMWYNPATQYNVEVLKERGIYLVGPETGRLACSEENAVGRLAGADVIMSAIENVLLEATGAGKTSDLDGLTIMVTAGGTREPIDPVRFIGNRSSGKMGYAVAEAAAIRGADVILVSGPSCLSTPAGVKTIRVETAMQMHNAVMGNLNNSDVVVMAAAVADVRPEVAGKEKMKKDVMPKSIGLTLNPDILQDIMLERSKDKQDKERKGKKIIIGFAAESDRVIENAMDKLERKGLDMIIANDISAPGMGFEYDDNMAALIDRDGLLGDPIGNLKIYSKSELAEIILDWVKKAIS